MSIEKKSLISTLKTTKKANVAKEDLTHAGVSSSSVKSPARLASGKASFASGKLRTTSGKLKTASGKFRTTSAKGSKM